MFSRNVIYLLEKVIHIYVSDVYFVVCIEIYFHANIYLLYKHHHYILI